MTQSEPAKSTKKAEAVPIVYKPGKPLVGVLLGAMGFCFVGAIALVVFYENCPYLLSSLDTYLQGSVRYQPQVVVPGSTADWRTNLLVEQTIWTDALTQMSLGGNEAKPHELKRDYWIFLADSYYRDEPKYEQARAAYMAVLAEPKIPHDKAIEMRDAELVRRIGFCSLRMGDYETAEQYLNQALSMVEKDKTPDGNYKELAILSWTRDNLTELYVRTNRLGLAKDLIDKRLQMIQLKDVTLTVEPQLLYNTALLRAAEGKAAEAENFFKRSIEQFRQDERASGVEPNSPKDSDRNLANVFKEYAHFLRLQKRPGEAYAALDQALSILDRAP